MTSVTLPNTSKSTTDPNLFSDVYNNDNAIVTVVNGNIDNTNIASGAAIALNKLASGSSAQIIVANGSGVPTYVAMTGDVTVSNAGVTAIGATKVTNAMLAGSIANSKLASSPLGIYTTIESATMIPEVDAAANTLIFRQGGAVISGTGFGVAGATVPGVPVIRLVSTDYAISGMTTKLNLRHQVSVNATAPAIDFTFALAPITVAGAADNITYTAGAAVTGSDANPHTGLGTSTISNSASGDFDFPADGNYALVVTTSGTLANNSVVNLSAQLRYRHV